MKLAVNGETIKNEEIKQEAERLRPEYEKVFADMDAEKREAQLQDWSKENVIERILLKQQALNDPDPIPQEAINRAYKELKKQYGGDKKFAEQMELTKAKEKQIKKDIETSLRMERLLYNLHQDVKAPSDEEISKYYNEHKDQFMAPEVVRAAHVVKHVNGPQDKDAAHEAIQKAKSELEEGMSFEQVAEKYSDCPDNGGDLGYFPKGEMVPEFEDVVFSMEIDQVSDIFTTQFGYHIAKLYDRKEPSLYPLEKVKDNIVKAILEDKRRVAVENYIDQLKEKAKIERS